MNRAKKEELIRKEFVEIDINNDNYLSKDELFRYLNKKVGTHSLNNFKGWEQRI